jgi:DNA-binding CsgD family transcriptional regulator
MPAIESSARENSELSERELEILRLVATGASNKEIAQQLFISANTVKVHLRNIFAKIGAASRTEAALYAVRSGLVGAIHVEAKEETGDGEAVRTVPEPAPEGMVAPGQGVAPVPRSRQPYWLFAFGLVFLVLLGWAAFTVFMRWPVMRAGASPATPTTAARWRELAEMPTARHSFASAVYDGQIFAIGGEGHQGVAGVVERFDPDGNTWQRLSSKPAPVTEIGAAVVGGLIYVPGGRTAQGEIIAALEVYDPRLDRWESLSPLPKPLSAYAILPYEGRLFVFGGWDGQKYVNSVYAYDPARDAWEDHPPMPTARGYAGTTLANGKIYVFGGRDEKGPVTVNEVFVPDREGLGNQVWSEAAPLPAGRYAMGAASIADYIHVIGGLGSDDEILTSLEYVPNLDDWQEYEGPFTLSRSHLSVVSSGVYLYILGGKHAGAATAQNIRYQAIFTLNIPVIR